MPEIINKRSTDVESIVSEVQKLRFDQNDENTRESIKAFYESVNGKVFSQNERIMFMSSLSQMSEFSNWLLGDMLISERERIESDWTRYERGEIEKPQYKSIGGFLDFWEGQLGFGRSKGYYCIELRERSSLDELLQIGVKGAVATLTIKDDKKREKIVKRAIEQQWDYDTIRERVAEENFKERDTRKQVKTEQQREVLKSVKYSVTKRQGRVIIEPLNVDPDDVIRALNYYEQAIKNYLAKC